MVDETKYAQASGVTRSVRAPAYHLIPATGLRRIAERFALGAEKHGARNWELGLVNEAAARALCEEAYNHLFEHLIKMQDNDQPEDDHLGAIGWAVCVLTLVEERFEKPWQQLEQ